jgi:hypothetical protein
MTPQEYIIWLDGFLEAVKDLQLESRDFEKCWEKIQIKAQEVKNLNADKPISKWVPSWDTTATSNITNKYNSDSTF